MKKYIVTALSLGIVAGALATSTAFAAPKPHSLSYSAARAYCLQIIPQPRLPVQNKQYASKLLNCTTLYTSSPGGWRR